MFTGHLRCRGHSPPQRCCGLGESRNAHAQTKPDCYGRLRYISGIVARPFARPVHRHHPPTAADILATTIAPTFDELKKLAITALIRTGLNYFLSREIREAALDAKRGTAVASQ